MSDLKQVKVDNWGIYFLQRLKHFFNRTDYCDLTLQFQDNAQLKVHRLVLNACTEYFELLERTCEMYEDCLVMPEDLQADVVVPIVNFMYTGQLEFRLDSLERLYQTSLIMNMPVLSKLLEAHRVNHMKNSLQNFGSMRKYSKGSESSGQSRLSTPIASGSGKRSYNAYEKKKIQGTKSIENIRQGSKPVNKKNETIVYRDKKLYLPLNKQSQKDKDNLYREPSPIPLDNALYNKKLVLGDPRPTRYELPEELDTDNIFDNSFTNISYTSKPLMVHPDANATKQYSAKKGSQLNSDPTRSKRPYTNSTVDIVECKKVKLDNIFDDDTSQNDDMFKSSFISIQDKSPKDPSQLFDQMLDNNKAPKITIEGKDQASNLDHAKIISEVLKKYPHLVKSNKNIKLKILDTPKGKKPRTPIVHVEEKEVKTENVFTYETDVLNSQEAAKLISMGAENIKGPWICLICGTPGRALNFTSYFNFRRHLVEVHKEKPVSTICEYCGLKSYKRNYLLHHIYTKHGVPPPPQYHFPKCNLCDYVALTEGFLVKHKLAHSETKSVVRCSVCSVGFGSNTQLLLHMQKSGHKPQQTPGVVDRKQCIQCSYCMKVFLRDNNFYAHLKTSHKEQAIKDGIIDDSDDEKQEELHRGHEMKPIKYEHATFENEPGDGELQYQDHKRLSGNIHMTKKARVPVSNSNQKILNSGYNTNVTKQSPKTKTIPEANNEFIQEINNPSNDENIVFINDTEYIMKDNQLIPRKPNMNSEEYILSDFMSHENDSTFQNLETVPPTTIEFSNIHTTEIIQPKMVLKKSTSLNQPNIQIVVSNEEEYKALMASNHPILFDDGDANKTLTVLTAPQSSTMDTAAIDLDNNQSNDMMIIQEDFPLSVSDAMSGDNSKYVVVYSHAVDHTDPNKQYQIITPQQIGEHFVQTSAVITPNYETIATSTPVMSANVIDAQLAESWPQSEQQNNQATMLVASETELHTLVETEQTNNKQVDTEHTLVDLPEVELQHLSEKSTSDELEQVNDNEDESGNVPAEMASNVTSEQTVVAEKEPSSVEESMNVDMQSETGIEKESTVLEESEISTEQEIQESCQEALGVEVTNQVGEQSEISIGMDISDEPDTSLSVQEESQTYTQEPDAPLADQEQPESFTDDCGDSIVQESNSVLYESEEIVTDDQVDVNIAEVMSHHTQSNHTEENPENEKVPLNNDSDEVGVAKEQIQNLASEWSEDEYDTIMEEVEAHEDIAKTMAQEPELEESIENIQQEIQKQIVDTNELVQAAVGDNSSSQINNTTILDESTNEDETHQPVTVTVSTEVTQEKISSLLNDWEDNDSQEEQTSINENGENVPVASEPAEVINENITDETEPEQPDTLTTDKEETNTDDNIKSLVSDWDDDEEENRG